MSGPAAAATAGTAAVRQDGASLPFGHWGPAQPIPGLAALNAGGSAQVQHVSCVSLGNCTAAGIYQDAAGSTQVFTANEVSGTWGQATPLTGLSSLNVGGDASATALSCSGLGACAIGGFYTDGLNGSQPFVADSQGGTFGPPQALFAASALHNQQIATVSALSCASPGNCTVAVTLPVFPPGGTPLPESFLASEVAGTWSAVQAIFGITSAEVPAAINSLSCWLPGDCFAGGLYRSSTGALHTLMTAQLNGDWHPFEEISGISQLPGYDPNQSSVVESVSCAAQASCQFGGIYHDTSGTEHAFVASIQASSRVPGMDDLHSIGEEIVHRISCGAPNECAVAGQFDEPFTVNSTATQAFVDSESAGTWGSAQQLLGISDNPHAQAGTVSCAGIAGCVAGGSYTDTAGHQQAWVAAQNDIVGTRDFGSFNAAMQVAGNLNAGGTATVNDVSCTFVGNCAVGGFYTDGNGNRQGFVADLSTVTTTTISVSPTTVAAGNLQQVRVTATVTGATGGTPTGHVTVLANDTQSVCTIPLSGGTGSCTLPAGSLAPGSYTLTGEYSGDPVYLSSISGGTTLTVLPAMAGTTTSLGLSAAKATFGHEQSEHLTVTVTAPGQTGDTPTGKVTVKAGSVTLGMVNLAGGKATITLGASMLRPGSYKLVASYGGDLANNPSNGTKTLTVAPEPTATALSLSTATVRFGHEQSEKLTVRVKPQTSGTPAGKVTIKAGSTALCAITLKAAKGSCTLAAKKLRIGKYQLTASYPGSTPYAGSTSSKKTLTVTK
jgi:Big-like domain-containing protein